jgi:hypothetical protein
MNRELQRMLEDAAWDGDAIVVAHLVQHPHVDPSGDHSTALLHAAHRGHWRCVELLIPVSNPLERSSEALWRAARYRHPRCVRLLAPVSDTSGWSADLWTQLQPRMRIVLGRAKNV